MILLLNSLISISVNLPLGGKDFSLAGLSPAREKLFSLRVLRVFAVDF
jgi:hypothetical protein